MGERQISVAVTPTGYFFAPMYKWFLIICSSRADAIARGSDGRLYFVEPYVEKMTMQELFTKLGSDLDSYLAFLWLSYLISSAGASDDKSSEVYYLQSQNGNLYSADSLNSILDNADIESEFEPLTYEVPKDIPWCSEALGSILSRFCSGVSTQFHQDTCQRQSISGLGMEKA